MEVPQSLTIRLTSDGARCCAQLAGVLDLSTAATASARLAEVLAVQPDELVLDLRDVTFLDSRGIAVIVEIANALDHGKLTLRHVTGRMAEQFEHAGASGSVTFDERLDDESPEIG